jgi:hypothetical protein
VSGHAWRNDSEVSAVNCTQKAIAVAAKNYGTEEEIPSVDEGTVQTRKTAAVLYLYNAAVALVMSLAGPQPDLRSQLHHSSLLAVHSLVLFIIS